MTAVNRLAGGWAGDDASLRRAHWLRLPGDSEIVNPPAPTVTGNPTGNHKLAFLLVLVLVLVHHNASVASNVVFKLHWQPEARPGPEGEVRPVVCSAGVVAAALRLPSESPHRDWQSGCTTSARLAS